MRRFRTRRLTSAVATLPIGTRVPQDIYDQIQQEAQTAGMSVAALLAGHMEVLYEREAYDARIRALMEADESVQGFEAHTRQRRHYVGDIEMPHVPGDLDE